MICLYRAKLLLVAINSELQRQTTFNNCIELLIGERMVVGRRPRQDLELGGRVVKELPSVM